MNDTQHEEHSLADTLIYGPVFYDQIFSNSEPTEAEVPVASLNTAMK